MKDLLHQISWQEYFFLALVAAVIYYAFIGWRYYRSEILQMGERLKGLIESQGSLRATSVPDKKESAETVSPDPLLTGPAPDLARSLNKAIHEAAEAAYSPKQLISEIKRILNDYPDVAASPDRETINALIVSECERTGTALLSESEVDRWWSA